MSFVISDPAELDRRIQMAAAAGQDAVGTLELLRAVRRGEIACLFATSRIPVSAFKTFVKQNAGAPTVVVLGDDNGAPVGPCGFPIAARAVEWAHSVMLHAAGAEASHYRAAIDRAKQCMRVLIVECTSMNLIGWMGTVKPAFKPTLIVAPIGGQHPISPRAMGRTIH